MFERFPFTNLHELNLDWIIQQLKDLESHAVLSVNGQTGDVVLYRDPDIVFPDVDSTTWRMVRTAGGNTVGIMFQNGLAYIMDGSQASRVYTVDDPPAYPVTSVNGQTGAVVTYNQAYNRLPGVPEQNTNFYRTVDSEGSPVDVGVQVDKNKLERMSGANRYKVYDEGNTPPYPVTDVNGQTGSVVLAIPFDSPLTDSVWMASEDSEDHTAGLGRETVDGTVQLYTVTDGTHAEAFIHFVSSDDQYNYTKKLLTTDDIPSSAGVISLNGQTGVVTLYGNTMPMESGSAITVQEEIDDLKADLAIMEDGNTATHNIPKGHFVCWKGSLYIANTAIAISDPLSLTNLDPVNNGGMNDLQEHIFHFPGDVLTDNTFEIIPSIISASQETLYFSIPVQKNLEYITSATINSFKAGVRIPTGGYLNANNYDYLTNATSVSVTIDKQAGMIKLQLNNTNKWSTAVANNTPLVATVEYTITLS